MFTIKGRGLYNTRGGNVAKVTRIFNAGRLAFGHVNGEPCHWIVHGGHFHWQWLGMNHQHDIIDHYDTEGKRP